MDGGPGLAAVAPLSGFAVERAGRGWRVCLGTLVSRQQLNVALELHLAAGPTRASTTVRFALEDADGALGAEACEVVFGRADAADVAREVPDHAVLREAMARFVDATRMKALELNYNGRFEAAAQVLHEAARRLEDLAGDDPEIKSYAAKLQQEVEEISRQMTALDRKLRYAAAAYSSAGKDLRGRSKRQP